MSRMIAKFEKKGPIEKSLSKTDSRVRYIRLTELGRRKFNRLSDIEYVISRRNTLYYAERHLSEVFSAYVDRIVYEFANKFNPETDCLNILECNGVPAGSIAFARVDNDTAQFRFFMLESG